MRGAKAVYTVIVSALAVSCGMLPRTSAPKEFDPRTAGYSGTLLPTFYYTEGIKQSILYGDPKGAVELFDKAIAADSLHAPSYYEAANSLIETDPARALPYSLRANALDSTNLWYQGQLGRLMVVNKNYDKALRIYDKLTREAPQNPDNHRLLAALYQQDNQPFTAIAVLDSAERRLGRIEGLADFKRQLLIQVRLYDKAIAESEALVRDFPFTVENHVALAELYAATGKDSLAKASFNAAQALDPTNITTLGALNDYYKNKGDNLGYLSTAREIFNSDEVSLKAKIDYFGNLTRDMSFYRDFYLQIGNLASTLMIKYPNDLSVLKLYTGHLIAAGDTEKALQLFKAHLSDTTELEIYNNILDIEAYLKRPDSVARYAALALKHFPENTDLYIRHGSILSYLKKDKEALAQYDKALKYAGSDSLRSVIYGIQGDLYHQQGNDKKSYTLYDKALRADSTNSMVLNNYSYFLSTSDRDLEKAEQMAQSATRLSQNNPTYLDTYAWALYKSGKYAEAKKVMQQAISLDRSGSAELLIHYGDILHALNDDFMAEIYWKKALEKGYDAGEIDKRMKMIQK